MIKGLLLKDFYNMKKTLWMMLVFLVVMGALFFGQSEVFFGGIAVLVLTMMTVTTMSYDHMAKWDSFAMTMPVTRRQLVAEKYLFLLMMAAAGGILALLLDGVRFFLLTRDAAGVTTSLLTTLLIVSAGILYGSVLLPLVFRFGTEKARLILLLSFLTLFLLGLAAKSLVAVSGIPAETIYTVLDRVIYLLPLVAVIGLILSYLISAHLFSKKEL